MRDMEVMVTPVSEQTMNNLSVQVRKGVERAFSMNGPGRPVTRV
jgi:hypothetical protein